MAHYGGVEGILSGLTKSTDHPGGQDEECRHQGPTTATIETSAASAGAGS